MKRNQCDDIYEILKEMAVKHKVHIFVAQAAAASSYKRPDNGLIIIDYPDLLKVTK